MEFLDTIYTIELAGWMLAMVAMVFIVLAAMSLMYIKGNLHLGSTSSQPKTGFLGKPLMQLGLVIVLGASLIGGFYYFQEQDTNIIFTQADRQYEVAIEYEATSTSTSRKLFELDVIPSVDNKEWAGSSEAAFDVVINIIPSDSLIRQGQKQVDFFEMGSTEVNPSSVRTELLPGDYEINVMVRFEEQTFGEQFEVNVR